MMRRVAALALAASMSMGLTITACANTNANTDAAASAVEDGQNPVMNFVGKYGSGRATIEVGADGSEGATVKVTWGSSASEQSIWEMSGPFDADTLTITYDNCVNKNVTFDEMGEATDETVVYENGKGSLTFEDKDGQTELRWADDQEHAADDMVFTYDLVVPDQEQAE
jgi:hypothetical protein